MLHASTLDAPLQSAPSPLTLLCLILPDVQLGSSWMWRLRRDGIRWSKPYCFGLFAPHQPVRFDMHDLSAQAEELFHEYDTDGSGSLSAKELKAAAKKAREKATVTRAQVHLVASDNSLRSGDGAQAFFASDPAHAVASETSTGRAENAQELAAAPETVGSHGGQAATPSLACRYMGNCHLQVETSEADGLSSHSFRESSHTSRTRGPPSPRVHEIRRKQREELAAATVRLRPLVPAIGTGNETGT